MGAEVKPGDRVEVRAYRQDAFNATGVVTRVRNYGWGDHVTVWARLDNGDVLAYRPEELRLIEGENA